MAVNPNPAVNAKKKDPLVKNAGPRKPLKSGEKPKPNKMGGAGSEIRQSKPNKLGGAGSEIRQSNSNKAEKGSPAPRKPDATKTGTKGGGMPKRTTPMPKAKKK